MPPPNPKKQLIAAQAPPATWIVPGANPVAFSYVRCEYTGGNRLVARERMHRDGAKQDDTAGTADSWSLNVRWFNGNTEPGINNPDAQYPDEVLRLIAACKIHETGTLLLPTYGSIRARASHWSNVEVAERVDYSESVFTFVSDNEDDAAKAFQSPSARSVVVPLMEQVVGALEDEGVWGPDVASLEPMSLDLEAALAAPDDAMADVFAITEQLLAAVSNIQRAFENPIEVITTEAAGLLLLPRASLTGRLLVRFADAIAGARVNAPGIAPPRPLRFTRQVSMLDVAALVDQELDDLMGLNSNLEDLTEIPPGIPVRVRTTTLTAAMPATVTL